MGTNTLQSLATRKLLKEKIDPKTLQVGVNKMKELANNALLVECESKTDRDVLQNELSKINLVTTEQPKMKLPTLLLKFVPIEIDDLELKDLIIQQNNLNHIVDPVLTVKFTKTKFQDSRHIVIEVSPEIRREMLTLQRIKLK